MYSATSMQMSDGTPAVSGDPTGGSGESRSVSTVAGIAASDSLIQFNGYRPGDVLKHSIVITNTALRSQRLWLELQPASGVVSEPGTSSPFTLDGPIKGSVAPGVNQRCVVVFTAPLHSSTASASVRSCLRVMSEGGCLDIALVAEPTAKALQAPSLLDFGTVSLLQKDIRHAQVGNPGAVPLVIHIRVASTAFSEFMVAEDTTPPGTDATASELSARDADAADAAAPAFGTELTLFAPPFSVVPFQVMYLPFRLNTNSVDVVFTATCECEGLSPPAPHTLTLLGSAAPGKGREPTPTPSVYATGSTRLPVRWIDRDPGLAIVDERRDKYIARRQTELISILQDRAHGVEGQASLVGDGGKRLRAPGLASTRPGAFDSAHFIVKDGYTIPSDLKSHAAVAYVLTQPSPVRSGSGTRGTLKPRDVATAVAQKRAQRAALEAAAAASTSSAAVASDGGRFNKKPTPNLLDPFSMSVAQVPRLAAEAVHTNDSSMHVGLAGGDSLGSISPSLHSQGHDSKEDYTSPRNQEDNESASTSPRHNATAFASALSGASLMSAILQGSWLYPFLVSLEARTTDGATQCALPPTHSPDALVAYLDGIAGNIVALREGRAMPSTNGVGVLLNAALSAHLHSLGVRVPSSTATVTTASSRSPVAQRESCTTGSTVLSPEDTMTALRRMLTLSTALTGIKNDATSTAGLEANLLRRLGFAHLFEAIQAEESARAYTSEPVCGETAPSTAFIQQLQRVKSSLIHLQSAVFAELGRLRRTTMAIPSSSQRDEAQAISSPDDAFGQFMLSHPLLQSLWYPSDACPVPLQDTQSSGSSVEDTPPPMAPSLSTGNAGGVCDLWSLPVQDAFLSVHNDGWRSSTDAMTALQVLLTRSLVQARVDRRLQQLRARVVEASGRARQGQSTTLNTNDSVASTTTRRTSAASTTLSRPSSSHGSFSEAKSIRSGTSSGSALASGSLASELAKVARQASLKSQESWVLEPALPAASLDAAAARLQTQLAGIIPPGTRPLLQLYPAVTGRPSQVRIRGLRRIEDPSQVLGLSVDGTSEAAATSTPQASSSATTDRAAHASLPSRFVEWNTFTVDESNDPLSESFWEDAISPALLGLGPLPLPALPADTALACDNQPLRDCRLYESIGSGFYPYPHSRFESEDIDSAVARAVRTGLATTAPIAGGFGTSTFPLATMSTTGVLDADWSCASLPTRSWRPKPAGVFVPNHTANTLPASTRAQHIESRKGGAGLNPGISLFGSVVCGGEGLPVEGDAAYHLDATTGVNECFTTLPHVDPSSVRPTTMSRQGMLESLPPALAHGVVTGTLPTAAQRSGGKGGRSIASRGTSVPGRSNAGGTLPPRKRPLSANTRPRPGSSASRWSGRGKRGGGQDPTVSTLLGTITPSTPDAAVDSNGVLVTCGQRMALCFGLSSLRAMEAPNVQMDGSHPANMPAYQFQQFRPATSRPLMDSASLLFAPTASSTASGAASASSGSTAHVLPVEERGFVFQPHRFDVSNTLMSASGTSGLRVPFARISGIAAYDMLRLPAFLPHAFEEHLLSDDSESDPDDAPASALASTRKQALKPSELTVEDALRSVLPPRLAAFAIAAMPGTSAPTTAKTSESEQACVTCLEEERVQRDRWNVEACMATANGRAISNAFTNPVSFVSQGATAEGAVGVSSALQAETASNTSCSGVAIDNGSVIGSHIQQQFRVGFAAV